MSVQFKLICQLIISLTVIIPFWGFVYVIFFHAKAIDPTMHDSVNQITGALLAAFAGTLGFWLGTSLSSSAKDTTISQLSNTQGTAR